MKTNDFYYNLPEELIAQTPAEPRDSARLLVYHRDSKQIEHKHFYDVVDYLNKGDLLVVNNTKVLPVRLYGNKVPSGGKIEFLLLKRIDLTHWEVILKPGRIAKIGSVFTFGDGLLTATVESVEQDGARIVQFSFDGVLEDILNKIGEMPLPPYIKQKISNKDRYNTVYSKINGSAAAPTAGLHFTNQLLDKIRAKGVNIAEVLLHVGLGTFRPVKVDNVEDHNMHSEYYKIDEATAALINETRQKVGRVIAVGTTAVRVLESVVDQQGNVHAGQGYTQIFLYPPHKIRSVDGLITNFHLPESTLIMLVSCMCSREEVLDIYNTAVQNKYRFFSFGDATMFI